MAALLDVRVVLALAVVAGGLALLAIRRPDWLLPGSAALGVLLCRPGAIGEQVPVLGPAVLTLVAALATVDALRRRTRDVGVQPWPFLLFSLAWVWLGLHRLLVPISEPNYTTSTITNLLPVLALYFVVRDRDLLRRTMSALVALVVVSAGLTVVALVLIAVVGPTLSLVGTVPLGYGGVGLYLPGALSYGVDPSSTFPRMLGLGREPGMGALVLGFAYFAMPATFPRPRLQKGVLLLALLATQSTAGIGIAGVCIVLAAVLGRRTFSPLAAAGAVLAGGAVVYVAVYAPSFGLLSKVNSTGESYATRNEATANGLAAMARQPFTAYTDAPLSSVNLIASIAVSGLPWALLAGGFLLAPVVRARRRDPLRYGALLVFVVMLTSQPLAGNAGVLLLAVLAYYAADRTPARPPVPADPPAPPDPPGPRPTRTRPAHAPAERAERAEPVAPAGAAA